MTKHALLDAAKLMKTILQKLKVKKLVSSAAVKNNLISKINARYLKCMQRN